VTLAERFKERFGALMEQFAVTGYVTVMMIADAIEKTGSTDPKTIADHVRNGRYVSPLYLWPFSYTEWGELKEARMSFAVIEKGDPPGRVNPGSGWHLRTFFVTSEPVKPYVPKGTLPLPYHLQQFFLALFILRIDDSHYFPESPCMLFDKCMGQLMSNYIS